MFNKKKQLRLQIQRVLNKIANLRAVITDEQDFLIKLSELHESYKSLMVLLDKEEYKLADVEEIIGNEFITYKYKNKTIIFSETFGLLSVEMGNKDLNKFIFDKINNVEKNIQKDEIKRVFRLYNNYTERNCNVCGSYVVPYDLSIPLIKTIEENEILSFHLDCFNRLKK